jgi:hypothetical protein
VLQQIEQFKKAGEEFMIQHTDTEIMEEIDKAVREQVIATCTPEERLRGIPVEELLRHISLKDAVAKLSQQELVQLRELIERRTNGDN